MFSLFGFMSCVLLPFTYSAHRSWFSGFFYSKPAKIKLASHTHTQTHNRTHYLKHPDQSNRSNSWSRRLICSSEPFNIHSCRYSSHWLSLSMRLQVHSQCRKGRAKCQWIVQCKTPLITTFKTPRLLITPYTIIIKIGEIVSQIKIKQLFFVVGDLASRIWSHKKTGFDKWSRIKKLLTMESPSISSFKTDFTSDG